MFGIHDFTLFLISSLIFIATPGIDAMFVLSRSISNGRASGIAASAGIATGAFVHTILSTIGLSIILSQSVVLFTTIKIIGGIYLIYIGIKSLLTKGKGISLNNTSNVSSIKKNYLQGVITNVANPKNILFYLSFLPQFASTTSGNKSLSFLLLGTTFAVIALLWYVLVTYFSTIATKTIKDNKTFNNILNKVSGIVFIALGMKLMIANDR
ncbi:LysE family translocator [Bacillus sp. V2I10]|uniref:LysE family translocator n=1 Tax=Bacillus sp. V2I10 TaxID=3042276 RepID=UPI002788986A|nr:LysE family translocator [Bacillus sp. V2I10]MDQ0859487.1 threonine/homoserine/homoserine lactone efflux protein [Bacillus sp. V2I10]